MYSATQKEAFCVLGGKKWVIFRMEARHIVICITSINSSTRRVHLNNTIFKMWCHVWIQRKRFEWLFALLYVSFSFSFLSFRSLWMLRRNSNVYIHILNAHCFQWGLFIGVSCFLDIYIGPWAQKGFALPELYFNEITNRQMETMQMLPCNRRDSGYKFDCHLRNLKSWSAFGMSPNTTLVCSNSNKCCLASFRIFHYKRIHWFDISFDGISGFLFLDWRK